MKLLILSIAVALLYTVAAHTVFTILIVNGADQGDGTCVRIPMTTGNVTYPVNDLLSNHMACGYNGIIPVARVCPVPQASNLSFVFREWADGSQPGSTNSSHRGPFAVYMKAVSSPLDSTAIGDGWFKILGSAYNNETEQWCTEKLRADNGLLSVKVPKNLAGGYYLVRTELLALQQADKTTPSPQFYVGCAQIFLDSKETRLPSETVSTPGFVDITDPGVLFNIWSPKWPYPVVGPAVFVSGVSLSTQVKRVNTQTEGLLPTNTVLTNANWWGVRLDPYSTEDGCWNASKTCFSQSTTCYATATPTGSKNCSIWNDSCLSIQSGCNANDFDGPPSLRKRGHADHPATAILLDVSSDESTTVELLEQAIIFLLLFILLYCGFAIYAEGRMMKCFRPRVSFTLGPE